MIEKIEMIIKRAQTKRTDAHELKKDQKDEKKTRPHEHHARKNTNGMNESERDRERKKENSEQTFVIVDDRREIKM